jgi:hypothetical protein
MERWPCEQSLSDKLAIVASPEMYSAASNGTLVPHEVENGLRNMHRKRLTKGFTFFRLPLPKGIVKKNPSAGNLKLPVKFYGLF